jgi:hypothetical protein
MSPNGVDPVYQLARRVLLDALQALGPHRDAVVLVGAHAIYLHTHDADFAVAEYTIDGDLAFDPGALGPRPKLDQAMQSAGFRRDERQPGRWLGFNSVPVDLLVPESLGGPGRRGARLGLHGNRAARKVRGIEGALVDRAPRTISSLDPTDDRSFEILVAGPAALLVAKLHKLHERRDEANRLHDKDAFDVFRLLRAIPTEELATGLRCLSADELSAETSREAYTFLSDLFARPDAKGSRMAARTVEGFDDPDTIAASCAALASDILQKFT